MTLLLENKLAFSLSKQMHKEAPNDWPDVRSRIAKILVDELMKELSNNGSEGVLLKMDYDILNEINKAVRGA